jgi:hypothetical protein
MDLEFRLFQTEINFKDNIKMANQMGLENIHGKIK